jgi:hypothetical protein
MDARKYRPCGNEGIRPGSALEGTRLNTGPTKMTMVAEIRATRYVIGSSRRWGVEPVCNPLSRGPCLTAAGGSQPPCGPRLSVMAGT